MKLKHIIFFSLSFFSIQAYGIDFEDAMYPELATSARALAMGNAFICKVDDSSAAFYNPAGLGSVRSMNFHLSNFHVEANKGWMDLSTGGKLTDFFGNVTKGLSLDGNRKLLLEKPGSLIHSRFHLLPNFTMRYLSLGYLYSSKTRSTIEDEAGATFDYADRLDHGPWMALNMSLFGGIFKIGGTGIYLLRKESVGSLPADQTVELTDSDYKSGRALMLNAGSRITLPLTFLPTLAVTFHNINGAKFGEGTADNPDMIRKTISLGASITPQISQSTKLHLEIDMRDFTNRYSEVGYIDKLLFGMEFDIARRFFFRAGYGASSFSLGLGMRTGKMDFDFTTYGAETTAGSGGIISFPSIGDRRYVLSISSGL